MAEIEVVVEEDLLEDLGLHREVVEVELEGDLHREDHEAVEAGLQVEDQTVVPLVHEVVQREADHQDLPQHYWDLALFQGLDHQPPVCPLPWRRTRPGLP